MQRNYSFAEKWTLSYMPIPATEMTYQYLSIPIATSQDLMSATVPWEGLIQDLKKTGSLSKSQVCNRLILNNLFFGAWFILFQKVKTIFQFPSNTLLKREEETNKEINQQINVTFWSWYFLRFVSSRPTEWFRTIPAYSLLGSCSSVCLLTGLPGWEGKGTSLG